MTTLFFALSLLFISMTVQSMQGPPSELEYWTDDEQSWADESPARQLPSGSSFGSDSDVGWLARLAPSAPPALAMQGNNFMAHFSEHVLLHAHEEPILPCPEAPALRMRRFSEDSGLCYFSDEEPRTTLPPTEPRSPSLSLSFGPPPAYHSVQEEDRQQLARMQAEIDRLNHECTASKERETQLLNEKDELKRTLLATRNAQQRLTLQHLALKALGRVATMACLYNEGHQRVVLFLRKSNQVVHEENNHGQYYVLKCGFKESDAATAAIDRAPTCVQTYHRIAGSRVRIVLDPEIPSLELFIAKK